MERTFSPMIRQYSAIDGLQQAYTLVYAMEVEGTQGCRLTLCQIGSRQQIASVSMLRQRRSSVTGSCATCVKMEFSRSSGGMRSQT